MDPTDTLASEAAGEKAAELYANILGDLPAFPPLALRLAELAGSEESGVEELVELLRSDAALSADLLRRANSPAYGFAARIDTLQQALVLLGFDELRRIAMATAAKGFAGLALTAPELRLCWRHSLAVALLAEELARGTGVAPERAYTVGVMHDIGRLGLLTARPSQFQIRATFWTVRRKSSASTTPRPAAGSPSAGRCRSSCAPPRAATTTARAETKPTC